MPWFKVDDGLPDHPKVLVAGNAAMGLWVRSGAWSMKHLTDGFIPEAVVALLGTAREARSLVTAGLWVQVDGGYRFHEWEGRQPSKEAVQRDRDAAADRQKRARERSRESRRDDAVTHSVSNGPPVPSRPFNQDLTSHPDLSSAPVEDDLSHLDPVIASVVRATAEGGLRISPLCAPSLIAFLESRRGVRPHPVKVPTRYYAKAIAESWPEVSKFIHEEGLAS